MQNLAFLGEWFEIDMIHLRYLLTTSMFLGCASLASANEPIEDSNNSALTSKDQVAVNDDSNLEQHNSRERIKERYEHFKEQAAIRLNQMNVDASATQPVEEKDPFVNFNRSIYDFNDVIDRYALRPAAVQAKEKVPEDVRSGYRAFRHNLAEPWNAVNQLIQGKPKRALTTLGRFTINTLTSLGFADPAQRLGLLAERESFGTTLGYYGVPSGPYVVLPFWGPSTFRDTLGLAVDTQGRVQRHIYPNDRVLWTDNTLQIINARADVLELEKLIQGDKYAALRDAYLQRMRFNISEKRGDVIEDESFNYDQDWEEDEIEYDSEEPVDTTVDSEP